MRTITGISIHFFCLFLLVVPVFSQSPKPIVPESAAPAPHGNHEIYRKHSLVGPFLDLLPKRKADKLRSILDQDDLTKAEIEEAVVEWVEKQDKEIQEKYASFKRALKVRLLRLKLKHELKMKDLSAEAKKLDEDIQNVIEDQDLTWAETCKKKNDLMRKASPKALKELGLRLEKCEEKRPESESEYSAESNEERPNPADYTNHHGGFDYPQGNQEFDYGEGHPRGPHRPRGGKKGGGKRKEGREDDRRQSGRHRGPHEGDEYQGNDYDNGGD